jgi:hypothetical protein
MTAFYGLNSENPKLMMLITMAKPLSQGFDHISHSWYASRRSSVRPRSVK